jgi:hypothetical protein
MMGRELFQRLAGAIRLANRQSLGLQCYPITQTNIRFVIYD